MKLRNKQGKYRQSYLDRYYGLILLVLTVATGMALKRIGDPAQEPFSPKAPPMVIKQVFASEGTTEPRSTSLTVDQIVDGIHMLESTRGKAKIGLQKYCEDRNGWNELGWGGMAGINGKKVCFKNKEEGFARVEKRIIDLYTKYDGDLGKVACYYNLGLVQDDCPYYQNLLKVINEN